MIFKMYDCDFGVTINGTNYGFTHVVSVVIEDPERRRLRRGSNASNDVGIDYREGLSEAKTTTATILGITKDLHNLLKQCFRDGTRMDFYAINKKDGSGKTSKNAVLSQDPKQLNMDDSPESMQLVLVFESFNVSEVHKSDE